MAVERDVREKGEDTMGLFVKGLRASGPVRARTHNVFYSILFGAPHFISRKEVPKPIGWQTVWTKEPV